MPHSPRPKGSIVEPVAEQESPYVIPEQEIADIWDGILEIRQFSSWEYLSPAAHQGIVNFAHHIYQHGAMAALREEVPSPTPLPPEKAWDREQIFERVQEVRRHRHAQYNKSAQSGLSRNCAAVGAVWGGLLSSWLGQAIPPIPGWLFCSMMAALKLMRIVWNSELDDSYVDAINYVALAEELAHEERRPV